MEYVLRTAIITAMNELELPRVDFIVEHPNETAHGDYAANVALVAAKAAGQPPRELAEQLKTELEGSVEYVDRIEVAGPGFLNFYLSRDFFATEVGRARELAGQWGANATWEDSEVMVEYTSPNLFKPLHIGNLVGNIVGESFTRLFAFSGATVRRMNYPSDIGLTVAKGVWGLQQTKKDPTDIAAIGEAYRIGNEAYENDPAAKAAIEAVNRALYAGTDTELTDLRQAGLETSKTHLAELCRMLGTTFDAEITESEASGPGERLVREHLGSVFVESEGAVVYQGEKVGLHTRVFLNSQGLPTYEAKDIGHFLLKQQQYPNWTHSLIVTGNEQREYFQVLYAALRDIFPEAAERHLEHVPTGFLTLTTGKMSSRLGNVLTGEALLDELMSEGRERAAQTRSDDLEGLTEAVAVAALKYQILRHGVGSDIVFDKERALSFEGDSGPYLQYTHARICSVLEKANSAGVLDQDAVMPEVPYEVERLLYRFPEVVEVALAERAPHHVTGFLTELASAFNTFYAKEPIADPADPHAAYKAAVADAVRHTLKNGLWVLGIEAPERM